ncbi:biotin--[acetyl-CoA-carboxylase] ligase [Caulobacter sp. BK020]|uniref:biotin--[acetyl-CoA-carboxylase] ligase n=1 Tax=Caulobacter sp. BK020 TaxID=2512117 RepID=UPI001044D7F6|nr:biotin--[acetyl-CoA-carboxylase] ligase [Caulobacter sp. BK020]
MTGPTSTFEVPPVVVLDEIDSTNAEARRRAEAGEAGPVWILGLRQTAGRGRRGRAWETGVGNLAATLLFTTDKPPAEAAQVTFVAALAVADLLGAYVSPDLVSLKWPNDPLLGGLKVSGVLVESGTRPAGGLWIAVGVGVNLARKPIDSERPATALTTYLVTPPAPVEAIKVLAAAFARWEDVWLRLGFPAIADAWTARAHGLGQPCVARLGLETLEGIAEGLDADGALRLRLADGRLRRITAGDVFFGEAS